MALMFPPRMVQVKVEKHLKWFKKNHVNATSLPTKLAQPVILLACIREIAGSNLCWVYYPSPSRKMLGTR
jgi:hypothetical protein